MNILDRIEAAATAVNAAEYDATTEKFVYCLDLLEISANHRRADHWVNELEDRFDEINAAN